MPLGSNIFNEDTRVSPPYKDYTVPHFGEDTDIKASKKNMVEAEAGLGVEMTASFASANPYGLGGPANPHKTDYFVPHFGED